MIQYPLVVADVEYEPITKARAIGESVIVEMVPPPEKVGSLYVPTDVGIEERLDVARVIASGYPGIEKGDLVAVRYNAGKKLIGFGWEEVTDVEVRAYGVAQGRFLVRLNMWDSILMRFDGENWKPTGTNVVVRFEPIEQTEGGILLSDGAKRQQPDATVVAVGDEVTDLVPGEKVVIRTDTAQPIDGMEENLYLVPHIGVLCAVG